MSSAKVHKYFYFGFEYHMIINDSDYMEVKAKGKEWSIAKGSNADLVTLLAAKGKAISREEFLEVFYKALSHCNHAYFMQTSDPASDEDIREKLDADQINDLYARNIAVSESIGELAKIE